MEKPLVSIGVPIYNAEEFLIERINSLVNQTYKNLEIIISDNASSDSSQKICEEFAKKDIRIKTNFEFIFHRKPSDAFNWPNGHFC